MLFFWLCVFLSASDLINTENVTGNFQASEIVNVDLIGSVAKILDSLVTSYLKPPLNKNVCKGHVFNFGANTVKLTRRPYGTCSFCCPLTHPENLIKLYYCSNVNESSVVTINLDQKAGALRAAGITSTSPTIFYFHGFVNSALGIWTKKIRKAYFSRKEDYNLIVVDWSELSAGPWYLQARDNVKVVAENVAKFIEFYCASGELIMDNIHLIGLSLGGQLAGFIGKFLKGRLPRITALDPAFPLFSSNDSRETISKNDARYVDIIHTTAGMFGVSHSQGHADFYPNAGIFVQPGCELSNLARTGKIEAFMGCSHTQSVDYYAESVRNPLAFPATMCGIVRNGKTVKTCNGEFVTDGYMGFLAKKSNSRGDFYLVTNDEEPFGKSAKEQTPYMKPINLIL